MNTLVARLRPWGWPLPAGLLALALAALLGLAVVPRWQAEADTLRSQARVLRAARPATAPASAPRPGWPAAARSSDRVATLLEAAAHDGVGVQRAQQRLEAVGGSPLQLLRLQQSASGRYADLRRHLAHALAADPALALERLRLQRADATSPQLDAELQWVLVQRSGAAPR